MTGWERFTDSFFNARVMAQYLPKIIEGFGLTVVLALLIIAAGLAAGLALALLRAFGIRPLNWLIIFVVDLFRALPPLVIIVLLFFGLPDAGVGTVRLRRVLAGADAGADGLLRGDLLGRHHRRRRRASGRRRARPASASCRRSSYVVLPQALRITIPPLTNRTIAITKGTALGSVVAVPEILGAANAGVSFSFNPSPLMLGAIAYLVLFFPVVVLGRWIETRFAWKR